MRFRPIVFFILFGLLSLSSGGCVGLSPPSVTESKPYSYISGGDQFGRDQLANRWLVAEKMFPLKGKDANEVVSILGQPSDV